MPRKINRNTAIAVITAACAWASAARAEVVLFSTNIKDQSIIAPASGAGITKFLDLTGSGVTKLNFTTTAAKQRVIITFSAGCSNFGASGAVQITILVDPAGPVGEIAVPPTNRGNGGSLLCRGGSFTGSGATVVASARPDVAGTNTVRVLARAFSDGASPTSNALLGTSLAIVR